MKTTCLVIGDEHFMVSNIPEVEMFIERIENLAKEKQPDFIVSLGDLLHTHEKLNTIALNKANIFIQKLREISPVYSIVGNHDMINANQFLSDKHWMNVMKEWKNVKVVDEVVIDEINGKKFVFVPYVFPGRFEEALNTKDEEWKNADCIFAHQEFEGCKMGAIVSVVGDKWPLEYPNVVSGHIHSRQQIQKNIYYTGSAMQHAFGESKKNTVAFLTFEEDNYDYILEEIDLNLPRKYIVYKDIEDVTDYDVKESEDKIKLSVSGTYEEFKSFKKTKKYKELLEKKVKVVFNHKKLEKKKEKDMKTKESNNVEFKKVLDKLVEKENNNFLKEIYSCII